MARHDPMSVPGPVVQIDQSGLRKAQVAMESGELKRAESLFVEHFMRARDDAPGLAQFGIFCAHTGRPAIASYLLYKANALQPGDSDILTRLGYAQLGQLDHEAARGSFEAVLEREPVHPEANHGLALCLQHAGAWPAAVDAFGKALAAQPDAVPILLNLAQACHRAGDMESARLHFANAVHLAPDDPAACLALGRFLREQGDVAQAMHWIDRCGRQLGGDPMVVLEKARCLRAVGEPAQAMRWLERLEERTPGLAANSEEYGNCLQGTSDTALRELHWVRAINLWVGSGDFAAAESLMDRLLDANPASAAGWDARGKLESARNRLDAAEAAWIAAIDSDPAFLDASASLTFLYEKTNRVDAAGANADRALRLMLPGERKSGVIELRLALCMLARRNKDAAAGLAHLAEVDALAHSDSQRTFAAFERGMLMDLQGDPSAAIAAFAMGNALDLEQWQREHPGGNKYLAGIQDMRDRVGKGWLQQWQAVGPLPSCTSPAFLIGFPRSGTTLLNQVLDCHDAIQTLEEKPPTQKMVAAVRNMPDGYPDALANLDATDIGYLRAAYLGSAAEHGAGDPSKLILDKFPLHINQAGLLHRVFPQARFVFALRHPCDVVLSCFMQKFRLNQAMANFCTLADTVALYTRTMDLWEMHRTQLPLNVHTVRYEDLVEDFDTEVRALCDFLQVPWQEGLKRYSERAPDRGRIDTPSYGQVSKPIYREARYRWERYREHLAPFLPALDPYVERFGYASSR